MDVNNPLKMVSIGIDPYQYLQWSAAPLSLSLSPVLPMTAPSSWSKPWRKPPQEPSPCPHPSPAMEMADKAKPWGTWVNIRWGGVHPVQILTNQDVNNCKHQSKWMHLQHKRAVIAQYYTCNTHLRYLAKWCFWLRDVARSVFPFIARIKTPWRPLN